MSDAPDIVLCFNVCRHNPTDPIASQEMVPDRRPTFEMAYFRLACRAGEISSSERSHETFSRHIEFFMQWKTRERKNVLPRGWVIGDRKIVTLTRSLQQDACTAALQAIFRSFHAPLVSFTWFKKKNWSHDDKHLFARMAKACSTAVTNSSKAKF